MKIIIKLNIKTGDATFRVKNSKKIKRLIKKINTQKAKDLIKKLDKIKQSNELA
jgi:hypothetical protein